MSFHSQLLYNQLQTIILETTKNVKYVQKRVIETNDSLPKTFYNDFYSKISKQRYDISTILTIEPSLKMSLVQGFEGQIPAIAYQMWLEKWLEIMYKHC